MFKKLTGLGITMIAEAGLTAACSDPGTQADGQDSQNKQE